MIAVEVQHYLGRARDLLKGMDLLQNDLAEYRYSSALLGIHGALSYCDALRIGLGSGSLSSDDHQRAVGDLKSLLLKRKFERHQGADRLGKLVSKKSKIAYSGESASEGEIKQIVLDSKRFEAWAEATGKELSIEGW